MKIVFITIHDDQCLGVRYLSSFLKSAGYSTSIISMGTISKVKLERDLTFSQKQDLTKVFSSKGNLEVYGDYKRYTAKEKQLLFDLLHRLSPDLICFSLKTYQLWVIGGIVKELRIRFKAIPIVFGGIAPTVEPERCIQYADIICLGEGEEALLELVQAIDKGKDIRKIRNLWIKKGNSIYRNEVKSLIGNLNDLPFPDYSGDSEYRIINNEIQTGWEKDVYHLMTSRGCIYHCSYCSIGLYNKLYKGAFFRCRAVENVIKELEMAKNNKKINSIYFWDNVFPVDKGWFMEFASEYKKRIKIPYSCYGHPNRLDKDTLLAFKDSGLKIIEFGFQSGSNRVLKDIFWRNVSKEKMISTVNLLKKLDIEFKYDIISNNPFENDDDCRETLNFLLNIPKGEQLIILLTFYPKIELSNLKIERKIEDIPCDSKRYLFWNSLYVLAGEKHLAPSFIITLSKSNIMRKHPILLKCILKIFYYKKIFLALFNKTLIKGKSIIKRVLK